MLILKFILQKKIAVFSLVLQNYKKYEVEIKSTGMAAIQNAKQHVCIGVK